MPVPFVAVTDSVFPNLDAARRVLSQIGAELRVAETPTPEAIVQVARTADAVLVTCAQVTAEMIQQMERWRMRWMQGDWPAQPWTSCHRNRPRLTSVRWAATT